MVRPASRGSSSPNTIEPAALLAHLAAEGLSKYDMPEFFLRVAALPLTASGKILKREVVELTKRGLLRPIPVRLETALGSHSDPCPMEVRADATTTHSLRRTKASIIYRRTGNLRAVQILLGHRKIESTVRYLGIEVDDALAIAEQVEV